MSAATKLPIRMTVDEFLDWNPGDGQRWQLIDGEPRSMSPTSRTHARVQARLAGLIDAHLTAQDSPCSVLTAPGIIPAIMPRHNYRIPDLAVTCTDYEREEYALSNPIFLVEILSPSNTGDTWANIWAYTSIPSVREILVVHTGKIAAELLRRQPDQTWPEPLTVATGSLTLDTIGLTLPVIELYLGTRLAR